MCTDDDLKQLFAEFPLEDIHWRAQSLTKDGSKAMALAYIDARDVMDRLDQVCGADSWQDSYEETPSGRVICKLSIRVNDEWIAKSDGAGSTAMEGEKGGLSDAFKRAAVKWGVGRYLYGFDAIWVPCESYETEYNGKKKWNWKRWTADPWSFVKGAPKASAAQMKRGLSEIEKDLVDCHSMAAFQVLGDNWKRTMDSENWSQDYRAEARKRFEAKRDEIKQHAEKELA